MAISSRVVKAVSSSSACLAMVSANGRISEYPETPSILPDTCVSTTSTCLRKCECEAAGVIEVIFIIAHRQDGVDHGDDGADFGYGKPRSDKLYGIGKHQQHAVFHFNAKRTQSIAATIGHLLNISIGVARVFVIDGNFI